MEATTLVKTLVPLVADLLEMQVAPGKSEQDPGAAVLAARVHEARMRHQVEGPAMLILPHLRLFAHSCLKESNMRRLLDVVNSLRGFDEWSEVKAYRRTCLKTISVRYLAMMRYTMQPESYASWSIAGNSSLLPRNPHRFLCSGGPSPDVEPGLHS